MPDESLDRLTPLADPVRRALYEFVVRQPDAVDRDSAAKGVGVGRPLAAFHLDRLAASGLLAVEFRRRSGRRGPGAGRPAKFYRRARDREIAVTIPPRRYDLAADILASATETSDEAREAALTTARDRGRTMALEASTQPEQPDLTVVLAELGYEPAIDADGSIRLRNCPFDRLATAHRDLTCALNLAMLSGVTDELDAGVAERVDPADGCCCVTVVRH